MATDTATPAQAGAKKKVWIPVSAGITEATFKRRLRSGIRLTDIEICVIKQFGVGAPHAAPAG